MPCAHFSWLAVGRFLEIWWPSSGTAQVFYSFLLGLLWSKYLPFDLITVWYPQNVQKLTMKTKREPIILHSLEALVGMRGHPRVSPVHGFAMVGSQMYGFLSYAKQSCRSSYLFLLVLEFLKWCLSTRIMQEEILLWIIHLDIPFNRTINHKKRWQKRAVWQNFLLECTHINNFPIYHHNIL